MREPSCAQGENVRSVYGVPQYVGAWPFSFSGTGYGPWCVSTRRCGWSLVCLVSVSAMVEYEFLCLSFSVQPPSLWRALGRPIPLEGLHKLPFNSLILFQKPFRFPTASWFEPYCNSETLLIWRINDNAVEPPEGQDYFCLKVLIRSVVMFIMNWLF